MSSSIMITGASSGIGKALAFELSKRGYALGLTARSAGRFSVEYNRTCDENFAGRYHGQDLTGVHLEPAPWVIAAINCRCVFS